MKKIGLAVFIILLLVLIFSDIEVSKVSASTEDRYVTPAGPDVPQEPMPDDFTPEEYSNTTNPYANPCSPFDQVDDEEGDYPLYVLVFADEEARANLHWLPGDIFTSWQGYAKWQLERGDDALVAQYGIDIRILDLLEWDSNDSIEYMTDPDEYDLCDELLEEKGNYLRHWFYGALWSDYVDAIIGITAQATPKDPNTPGVSSSPVERDEGKIFVLLKWQVYWKDDNTVQHEISHIYYADDHTSPTAPCCVMSYHPHFHYTIIEGGRIWIVWADVLCCYTAYSWCSDCVYTIQHKRDKYLPRTLTISADTGGTTNPPPGTYEREYEVTVWAYNQWKQFAYWILDGRIVRGNPITVTMDSNHNLIACFGSGQGGGCPTLFVWNGTVYSEECLLDIHAESDVTVLHEIQNALAVGIYKLQLRELDNFTSHIDQVKLYAVDDEGEWHLCPLIYAKHEDSYVTWKLLFDDENRVNLTPTQIIDLKFLPTISYFKTAAFIFQINGYNEKPMPM
jgi:hypothetical protein